MATLLQDLALRLQQGDTPGAKSIVITIAIATVLVSIVSVYLTDRPYKDLPISGGKTATTWQAKKRWLSSARELMNDGLARCKGPFQVIGNVGPLIILPPSSMEEVRHDERMTFKAWLRAHFFTDYPGFNGFVPAVESDVFVLSVKTGLAHNLGRATETLNEETQLILSELYPYNEEWHEIHLDEDAAKMIARLSTCIFMPDLVRNEEWLKIAVDYTVHFFTGAFVLRMMPPILRPLLHWFLPFTRQLRKDVANARRLIEPIIKARQKKREEAEKEGRTPEKYGDAIEWVETIGQSKGLYCDPVYAQLNYTLGAVHTTSITFGNTLYDLIARPEYQTLLLEEIAAVEKEDPGWTKASLAKLKLMDSFMKESTRVTPVTMLPINRVAEQSLTLADGTKVPKGATLGVPTLASTDPSVYPDPLKFDGHRFLNLGKQATGPGAATKYSFVGTSNEHIIFGHGKHACPGRFFANNEIKILLIHLLQGYEFKFLDGSLNRPKPMEMGADLVPNPATKILIRSKKV